MINEYINKNKKYIETVFYELDTKVKRFINCKDNHNLFINLKKECIIIKFRFCLNKWIKNNLSLQIYL